MHRPPQSQTNLPNESRTCGATAARIAWALGKSKRGVLFALASIPAIEGEKDGWSRGQVAQRWPLSSLPERMLASLSTVARGRGYRDAAHLLDDPPTRWQPPIPITEISPHHIQKAERLRRALCRTIAQRDTLPADELLRLGLEDYARELGAISEDHWRRVFRRTLDRDGGAEQFGDIVLYLDERLSRRAGANIVSMSPADRRILDACAGVQNLLQPTAQERELIWVTVCEVLHDRMVAGEKEKRCRRDLATLLKSSGVHLAKNDGALRDAVKRKFEQWRDGGMNLASIADQRPEKSGWHRREEISEGDRLAVISRATLHCGGRVAQAVRECFEQGLVSDEFADRFGSNVGKSYVPRDVREAVAGDVRRLSPIHHGPREHKLRGAFHSRDWSQVAAGDWFQADDLTPPVYYWKETARGVELMRGQFLPMADERTTFIMGFVLISARNYNSLAIRSLITTSCTEHGLPRRGFAFERGIWQSSKILTGSRNAVPLSVADHGLRSLGLSFRHAQLPRGKVIERTLGQLQDRMEGLPGYCGRQEQTERFERFQRTKLDVEAGRVAANEHFLSEEEIAGEFERIIVHYNNESQQGRKLDGISPREGWEQLQSAPRVRFDDRCLYLLAHDCQSRKIGRNGITITIGKHRFNYKGEETGRRQGETVICWFNPQRPEVLACTDEQQRGLFTVERSYDTPAVDCPTGFFKEEQRKIAAHNGYATDLYRIIRNPLLAAAFRENLVDGRTAARGAAFEQQRTAIETRSRSQRALAESVERKAARVGLPAGVIQADAEDASRGLEMLASVKRHEGSATETAALAVPKKTYTLKGATPAEAPLTKQELAIYWSAWQRAEKARPGLDRHAITRRILGCNKTHSQLSRDEWRKLISAFSQIVGDAQKPLPPETTQDETK